MIEDNQTAIRKLIDDIDAAEKHILALRVGRFEDPSTRVNRKLIEVLDTAAQEMVKHIANTQPSTRFVSRELAAALRNLFPDVKFTVRTTWGISVRWVDGPTTEQVKAALLGIGTEEEDADYYSSSRDIVLDGRKVSLNRIVTYVDDDDNDDIIPDDVHAEAAE